MIVKSVRKRESLLALGGLAIGGLVMAPMFGETALAQVFQLNGGSSSLIHVHGGSVEIRGADYEGRVGVGKIDRLRLGAFFRAQRRGYTVGAGDDAVPFELPTDVFNNSHYFLGRGLEVSARRERWNLFAFAGKTSTGLASPFFGAARAETGVGLLFVESQWTSRLRAFSRMAISKRQTMIHALEWQPRNEVRGALAAGVGANNGYVASSLTVERDWLSLKTEYVRTGEHFRRVIVTAPLSAEVNGANAQVTLRWSPSLTVTAGSQGFLQPAVQGSREIRGRMNQLLTSLNAGGFALGGAIFESEVQGVRSHGRSLSVGRDITGRLHANVNILRSGSALGSQSTLLVAAVRENVSPRLSLTQTVTGSEGQVSFSFGGAFLSNRISIGVEHQTVYVPLLTNNPFKQAMLVNIRVQPFGNFQGNLDTYISPDGSLKYGVGGSTVLYGALPGAAAGPPPMAISFGKYMVRGRVVDADGTPLRGVALRIDEDVVYTDSLGEFFARKGKHHAYPLEVVLDEFLIPGRFEIVSAPTQVMAAPEDRASPVTITLRRT